MPFKDLWNKLKNKLSTSNETEEEQAKNSLELDDFSKKANKALDKNQDDAKHESLIEELKKLIIELFKKLGLINDKDENEIKQLPNREVLKTTGELIELNTIKKEEQQEKTATLTTDEEKPLGKDDFAALVKNLLGEDVKIDGNNASSKLGSLKQETLENGSQQLTFSFKGNPEEQFGKLAKAMKGQYLKNHPEDPSMTNAKIQIQDLNPPGAQEAFTTAFEKEGFQINPQQQVKFQLA